jgi:hypothetical protein
MPGVADPASYRPQRSEILLARQLPDRLHDPVGQLTALPAGLAALGTRNLDHLYRGRTGVAHAALSTGAPILPVALEGTQDVQPLGLRALLARQLPDRLHDPVGQLTALPAGLAALGTRQDVQPLGTTWPRPRRFTVSLGELIEVPRAEGRQTGPAVSRIAGGGRRPDQPRLASPSKVVEVLKVSARPSPWRARRTSSRWGPRGRARAGSP